jgi:MFS-type transporter involved in bile tolerance (Atg22 family)
MFGLVLIKNDFGRISAIIIAVVFLGLFFIKKQTALSIVLKIIALIHISYVINDVIYDTFLTTSIYSDAVRLEQLTGLSDWVWGGIWLLMAAIALYFILHHMLKPGKK